MSTEDTSIPRRRFLQLATTALAAGSTLLAGLAPARAEETVAPPGATRSREAAGTPGVVRVASVSTSVEGGLLPALIEAFTAEIGLRVTLTDDDDLYVPAREGKFDLLISHLGHRDAEEFVLKGYGLWPRTVFSNQLCLFGPPADPAKVRGRDLVSAFRRIAEVRAPYVVNENKGTRYLTEILWNAAGRPPKGAWFIDSGISKKTAMMLAAERKAYGLWGLTPFVREQKKSRAELVPLVTTDPLLQRIMVAIVVNPDKVQGVNAAGAARFQQFLLAPSTQARIMTVRYSGAEQATWVPAGRHNAGAALPGRGGGRARRED